MFSSDSIVRGTKPLGFPWFTQDPFLFCVHHDDAYPAGNDQLGPAASLAGRNIGMDFEGIDGWRMYHGDIVPGFPRHPHRGFETITIARRGFIDHSDSLGATARFGHGDVQWMTAGKGIVHSEMFPLVDREQPNPCELFQIWLNLPRADKMVDPYFTMLWSHTIPELSFPSEAGSTTVRAIAGNLGDATMPAPPPNSWAARAEADIAVWTINMTANASWTLPAAQPGSNRTIYFFRGASVSIAGQELTDHRGVLVRADADCALVNGDAEAELLVLQGKPIGEPVAHYGPFVMNSGAEIQQAMIDYQRTQFGGWPWKRDDPVHERDKGRFAVHADGRTEQADGS